jgi:hypothetical protein
MGVRRWSADGETMTLYHFGSEPLVATVGLPGGAWDKIFDTAEPQWNGPGSSLSERVESSGEVRLSLVPYQVAVYKK